MSDILFQITTAFFFLDLVSNALFYIKLFEDKEYNPRRLFVHLRETRLGKSLITGRVTIARWVIILSYLVTVFASGVDFYYHLLVFTFYSLIFINLIKRFLSHEISLPKFSKTAAIVFILSIGIETILYVFAPVDHFLWMLILDKLLLVFITIFILFLSIFIDFGRDVSINRAIEKISLHPKLLSIGVVGSYGRGSTKEFISRVLALKFNVLASNNTYATSLGIAQEINTSLTNKKQIFIAEIDDYKKEDMVEMGELVNPKILVICGINEQKLSVFKSIEAILESKRQAVSSLSRDGIALFNGNSPYSYDLYNDAHCKKFIYGVGNNKNFDIRATNVTEEKFGVSFTVSVLGKSYRINNLRLLGKQNIENVLPAIFIGVYSGLDFSKIRQVLSKIRPLPGTMTPLKLKTRAIVIDDTYNANINSVQRALSYMKLYEGKKILVLEPLVELGKIAKQTHLELGREIGQVCDYVFLTNDNFFSQIRLGIIESKSKCHVTVATPAKIVQFLKTDSKRGDVILFEGHEAGNVLKYLSTDKIF